MKRSIVTAQFNGKNGSAGYATGEDYMLRLTHQGAEVRIHPIGKTATAETQPVAYSNIHLFLENWGHVEIRSSAEHETDLQILTAAFDLVGITYREIKGQDGGVVVYPCIPEKINSYFNSTHSENFSFDVAGKFILHNINVR
jgi:hypothetical protein